MAAPWPPPAISPARMETKTASYDEFRKGIVGWSESQTSVNSPALAADVCSGLRKTISSFFKNIYFNFC